MLFPLVFSDQRSFEEETNTNAGRDIITKVEENPLRMGAVEDLLIKNQNIPPWVMLLIILGWLLPTPTEIFRSVRDFFLDLFGRRRTSVQRHKDAIREKD